MMLYMLYARFVSWCIAVLFTGVPAADLDR